MNIHEQNNLSALNVTDDMFRELFPLMDIQIMVTDLETDKIIYANEKMNAAYNVDYDPTGKRCWETYQKSKSGRCEFCPLYEVKGSVSWSAEWEVFNEATGRWFHNKSSIIRWMDGRLVHLEQGTDITNIRKTNAALRDAEAYTQMMLDSTPISCAVWDENGTLLDANQQSLRLLGIQEKSTYLNDFYSLSPHLQADGELSREKAKRMVSLALESGFTRFDWTFKSAEGERIPADVMLIRVPYKNGFRVLSYTTDLRETKASAAATEHYTHLLYALSDISVAFMAAKPDSFEEVLLAQLRILGEAVGVSRVTIWENYWQGDEIWHRQIYRWASDERWLKNIHPLYYEEDYNALPDHKQNLFANRIINRRVRDMADAERIYFTRLRVKSILMIPIMTNNRLWGFICFDNCVDETLTPDIEVSTLRSTGNIIASAIMRNRVKANLLANERELKLNSRLLGAVNHVADNLLAEDDLYFSHSLQVCLEILGRSVDANRVSVWKNFEDENGLLCSQRQFGWIEGQPYEETSSDLTIDFASYVPQWDKNVKLRRDINMPLRQMDATLRNFEILENSQSLLLVPIEMNGNFWGFVGYAFDHEERLLGQAETDILRSGGTMIASAIIRNETNQRLMETDEALASIRAKNEFMARMSHEIRTPMNAIIGMTTIAKRSDDIKAVKEALDVIDTSSEQLLILLNDILDMSATTTHSLGIVNEPFSLMQMLSTNLSICQRKIEEKQQHIHYDLTTVHDRMVIGDEKRITKIIANLLSNAIKFTNAGGEITLRLYGEATQLTIEVIDNGCGISKEYLSKIFDLFEQEDGGVTRHYGGIGLGLPITKNLVSLMGGTISVESEQGRGCKFTVELPIAWGEPCAKSTEQPLREALPPVEGCDATLDWCGKCALLVEDNEINQLIAMELIASTGVFVECAENGQVGLEMFASSPDKYDLIFMDLQMPVMDGLEATRQIRSLCIPRAKTIPIYAMTANAYKSDVEFCLEAGMNGHIAKPVDVSALYKAIEDAFSG